MTRELNSIHAEFPCGDIILEGELHLPQGRGPFLSVVVCHPHPLYGGDMMNNVVMAICQELPQHSIAVFRFNFRGVGGSGGAFGEGITEQDDVKAALTFLSSRPDIEAKRIGLAGYSFGASVALRVALQDERVSLLALVSPPLSDADWVKLREYNKPKFLMVGNADFFILTEGFQQCVKDMAENKEYLVMPGADHFWWEYEEEVAEEVARFFVAGFSRV